MLMNLYFGMYLLTLITISTNVLKDEMKHHEVLLRNNLKSKIWVPKVLFANKIHFFCKRVMVEFFI